MKTAEFYILQALFFIVYLPLVTLSAHFALSVLNIQNNNLHAIVYFSLYGFVCVYNTRKFSVIHRKGKYLIIFVPALIGAVFLSFWIMKS